MSSEPAETHEPDESRNEDGSPDPHNRAELPRDDASNLQSFNAETIRAPSLPDIFHSTVSHGSATAAPRETLGDFELLRELGKGASGAVYLARQISLDRRVALKVTADVGSEALTMASLEHKHIVQVFSEQLEPSRGERLLCMQYVPGMTLQALISELDHHDRTKLTGRDLLAIIDGKSDSPTLLDTDGLRDREFLGQCDFVEAACWMGARLAEALAFAHRRDVLHRDIKPANILLDSYGRPLLADFSLSARVSGSEADQPFGGTLPYMAPEHLDAFNPDKNTPPEAVNEQSDIYSLGVVLFELLTGQLVFPAESGSSLTPELLAAMADQRRESQSELADRLPMGPDALGRLISRCLEPDPQNRFAEAADLAESLDGCGELQRVQTHLPRAGFVVRAMQRYPLFWLLVVSFIPHLLGTILSALYAGLEYADALSSIQMSRFAAYCVLATLLSYPCFLGIVAWYMRSVIRAWTSLASGVRLSDDALYAARQRVNRTTKWAATVQAVGWFAMFVLTGLAVRWIVGPMSASQFGHFVIAFPLAAMIAMTFSLQVVQFLCVRVFYPRLWPDARHLRTTARVELAGVPARIRVLQAASGALPLTGACLLVLTGPDEFSGNAYQTFRFLVIALIVLGIAGFQFSASMGSIMRRTLAVLLGRDT